MKKYIKILGPTIDSGRILHFQLSYSKNIRKYLLSNTIDIEYDEDISMVPVSILSIPALAGIVLLAWHIGADVYLDEIDEEYLNSLETIKNVFKKWYPQLPFSIIQATKVTSANNHFEGYGQLFSGGLDCAATYIKNRNNKPHLYYCYPQERQFSINIGHLVNFAHQENLPLSQIKTNIRDVVDTHLMLAKFGVEWWGQISHAVVFTSLCAPLTNIHKIGTLLISSSFTPEFDIPYGSVPQIDNNICWDYCRVVHYGYELTRQDKTKLLKKYIECEPGGEHILTSLTLVTWGCIKPNTINIASQVCGKCSYYMSGTGHMEKCLLNIVGFTLEGLDPNRFGFNVDDETFSKIRQGFIKRTLYKRNWLINTKADATVNAIGIFFWKDKQKNIPDDLDSINMYNSREFFEWFKNYDLSDYKPKQNFSQFPRLLLSTISLKLYPYFKAKILKGFVHKIIS